MKISSIMTEKVLKVRMDDSFSTIRDILDTVSFHHLLVVEDKKLVGVISDRDVLKLISPLLSEDAGDRRRVVELEHRKVHQIMTRNPVTVDKDMSVDAAVKLMLKNNISCLPVVAHGGEVDGVLTSRDILKSYMKEQQ